MDSLQFKGFRFSDGDKVIIKDKNIKGTVEQCRYEIVYEKGKYIEEYSYQVRYNYGCKKCLESEIKYELDLDPNSEVNVLSVIIDANLLDGKFDFVKQFDEERNKLKGE